MTAPPPSLAQTLAKEALNPNATTPTLAKAQATAANAGTAAAEAKKAKAEEAGTVAAAPEAEVGANTSPNSGLAGRAGIPGLPGQVAAVSAASASGSGVDETPGSAAEVSAPTHRVAVETQGRQAAQSTQSQGDTQQNQTSSNTSGGGNMEGGTGGGDGNAGGHSSGGHQQGHQQQAAAQNAIANMPISDLQALVQMLFGDGQNASGQNSGKGSGEGSGDSEVEEVGEVETPAAEHHHEEAPVQSAEEAISARTLSRVSDLVDPTLDFSHILKRPGRAE